MGFKDIKDLDDWWLWLWLSDDKTEGSTPELTVIVSSTKVVPSPVQGEDFPPVSGLGVGLISNVTVFLSTKTEEINTNTKWLIMKLKVLDIS